MCRSNGSRKDRRAEEEEEDNDHDEDNFYDYDDDDEVNFDDIESLLPVSKLALRIKYPETLTGFPHSLQENVRTVP